MRAYSHDLRKPITNAIHNGLSNLEAARQLSLHPNTVKNSKRQQPATGSLEPKHHP